MQDSTPRPQTPRPKAKDDKAARLAEALRANLARRKAQQRARVEDEASRGDDPES